MSMTSFKSKDLGFLGKIFLKVLSTLKLAHVATLKDDMIEMNNLTLINFVIYVLGPMHERTVVVVLMTIQVHVWFYC